MRQEYQILEQALCSEIFMGKSDYQNFTNLMYKIIKEFHQNLGDLESEEKEKVKNFIIDVCMRYCGDSIPDRREADKIAKAIIKELKKHCKKKGNTKSKSKEYESKDKINTAVISGSVAVNAPLDDAINSLNQAVKNVVDKPLSGPSGIHGDVAEIYHVGTFNVNAVLRGSKYRAAVLYGERQMKDSVDIGIFDNYGKGAMVDKYQSKFSCNASTTASDTLGHDYSEQHLLVASDQCETIKRNYAHKLKVKDVTDKIEKDRVSSQPISRKEAGELVERINKEEPAFRWNTISIKDFVKYEIKQTGKFWVFHSAVTGTPLVVRLGYNFIKGKEDPSLKEKSKRWLNSTVKNGVTLAFNAAITTAIVVAIKKRLIKRLEHTPPGKIAGVVAMVMDKVKIIYKAIKGEIKLSEAISIIIRSSVIAFGSLLGVRIGSQIGSRIGSYIAPGIGTLVGYFAGAFIGGFIGEKITSRCYDFCEYSVRSLREALKKPEAVPSCLIMAFIFQMNLNTSEAR